jgi:heme A synthase
MYDGDVTSRLARFAWVTLAYNVAVILWGAYVRASGSGAGCGSHWPLCNGVMLPRSPTVATLVEFSHRLTSGLALLAVVLLLVATWRARPKGDPARLGAALSLFFMLTEAAVGAGLVLFRLVADNASFARAMFMAVHLANTFLLLAMLSLTAWWLSDRPAISFSRATGRATLLATLGIGIIIVGISGAIAALGDTLYPSASLSHALQTDLSSSSHLLLRLRVLHPMLAVAVGLLLIVITPRLTFPAHTPVSPLTRYSVAALASTQMAAGFLNLLLLAPVWMQLLHLLLADLVWIAFILLAATALAREPVTQADRDPARARWTDANLSPAGGAVDRR